MTNQNSSNGILVDVHGVYQIIDDKDFYILDSFSNESEERFPVIFEISKEYAEIAKKFVDKQLFIQLVAIPSSIPEIYSDEKEFTQMKSFSFPSQSFLASPDTIRTTNGDTPALKAMITGIVKSIDILPKSNDEDADYYEVQISCLRS